MTYRKFEVGKFYGYVSYVGGFHYAYAQVVSRSDDSGYVTLKCNEVDDIVERKIEQQQYSRDEYVLLRVGSLIQAKVPYDTLDELQSFEGAEA